MEAKINIAAILKDKPQGIRLYSPIFGECAFCYVREDTDDICVKKHNGEKAYFNSKGLYCTLGEVMLFPSRKMRDWHKFAWKKGDILVGCAKTIIFDGFTDDTYTFFKGKYCLEQDPYGDEETYRGEDKGLLTKYFHIQEQQCTAQTYINTIEKKWVVSLIVKHWRLRRVRQISRMEI